MKVTQRFLRLLHPSKVTRGKSGNIYMSATDIWDVWGVRIYVVEFRLNTVLGVVL